MCGCFRPTCSPWRWGAPVSSRLLGDISPPNTVATVFYYRVLQCRRRPRWEVSGLRLGSWTSQQGAEQSPGRKWTSKETGKVSKKGSVKKNRKWVPIIWEIRALNLWVYKIVFGFIAKQKTFLSHLWVGFRILLILDCASLCKKRPGQLMLPPLHHLPCPPCCHEYYHYHHLFFQVSSSALPVTIKQRRSGQLNWAWDCYLFLFENIPVTIKWWRRRQPVHELPLWSKSGCGERNNWSGGLKMRDVWAIRFWSFETNLVWLERSLPPFR